MLSAYEPSSHEDVPGSLHWRERSDGHWVAISPAGGHYEIVPTGGVMQAWRMARNETPKHIGDSSTLGGAMMACRRDLTSIMYPSRAAEGASASEDGCAHAHPPSVPSSPCPDPSLHGAHGSVVTTMIDQTRASVERTRLIAGEGRKGGGRGRKGGRKVTIACEAPARSAHQASEAGTYATTSRDPREVEAGRALGIASSPRAVYDMVSLDLSRESQEIFLTIPVDLRGQPLSRPVEVARGQNDRVAVEPSDILAPAVEKKAKGFVAIHVHPSGHAKPSAADIRLTKAIEEAAKVMRIEFLDHVIVASSDRKGEFFSFRENGYLGRGKPKRSAVVHKVSRA